MTSNRVGTMEFDILLGVPQGNDFTNRCMVCAKHKPKDGDSIQLAVSPTGMYHLSRGPIWTVCGRFIDRQRDWAMR